jgi:hypothetical protein
LQMLQQRFLTVLCLFLSPFFFVRFINIGIIPNGSTTANNWIVEVKTLLKKTWVLIKLL